MKRLLARSAGDLVAGSFLFFACALQGDREPIIYLVNPDSLAAISQSLGGAQPAAAPPQVLWNIEWLRLD